MKAFEVRVLLGALLLFCMIAGGFTLWYYHERKKLAEEDSAFKQRLEKRKPAHTRAPPRTNEATENTPPVGESMHSGNTAEVPRDTEEHSEPPERAADSEAELAAEETAEVETADAAVPVSPYGFGPYPPLPEGWPSDIWPRQSANHELMMRVEIKLAHQGIDVRGSMMDNGLVYPMIPGTVYVEWKEYFGPPGIVRYIAKMIGDPEASDRIRAIEEAKGDNFTEADIPSDIKIVPFEEGGIEPYQFLNLQQLGGEHP